MRMLMCKYLKNNSLIACILWNQGYFGHFDYVMCFSCRGGPKWAPYTLGGASAEIRWQEGRLDDKYSKSHPEAYSHQDASPHPEAKLHPEAELLEERRLTSGSGCTSGSERAGADGRRVTSGSLSPSVSEYKSQTAQ